MLKTVEYCLRKSFLYAKASHFINVLKKGEGKTKQKYFRGVDVINILSGLLLVLGTGAIIIVMQNFFG